MSTAPVPPSASRRIFSAAILILAAGLGSLTPDAFADSWGDDTVALWAARGIGRLVPLELRRLEPRLRPGVRSWLAEDRKDALKGPADKTRTAELAAIAALRWDNHNGLFWGRDDRDAEGQVKRLVRSGSPGLAAAL